VAFATGLGDGGYEVWATVMKVDEFGGERVCKIEIEFIKDDDRPT
jgi:hypothetical protein